jgi:hypothetical protein
MSGNENVSLNSAKTGRSQWDTGQAVASVPWESIWNSVRWEVWALSSPAASCDSGILEWVPDVIMDLGQEKLKCQIWYPKTMTPCIEKSNSQDLCAKTSQPIQPAKRMQSSPLGSIMASNTDPEQALLWSNGSGAFLIKALESKEGTRGNPSN